MLQISEHSKILTQFKTRHQKSVQQRKLKAFKVNFRPKPNMKNDGYTTLLTLELFPNLVALLLL